MIEEIILQAMQEDINITSFLATYANKPAIFYAQAPDDKSAGWGQKQYPRIDYLVDWRYDAERKTAGSMSINVWCLAEHAPEDLGLIIQNAMADYFFTDTSGTYYAVWSRTDLFDVAGQTEPKISGATITFDILTFPSQETTTPDPTISLSSWIKSKYPETKVIGIDAFTEKYKPSDVAPAIYVRLTGANSVMRNTYAAAWLQTNLVVHVIAPGTAARLKYIKQIAEAIAIDGETTMSDNSPMIIKQLSYNTAANPLTTGQITLMGEYGVLKKEPIVLPLNHIYTNIEV
jgi:hypothetical protein